VKHGPAQEAKIVAIIIDMPTVFAFLMHSGDVFVQLYLASENIREQWSASDGPDEFRPLASGFLNATRYLVGRCRTQSKRYKQHYRGGMPSQPCLKHNGQSCPIVCELLPSTWVWTYLLLV
jgi:hypothetical protein